MATAEFAVVDVETTGFSPAKHDRVIEIAIVRVDGAGRILDEYATLVNPRRDAGPTRVHGITAEQLAQAPEFVDIAGDVLQRLSGAVFTAHNARFDLAFVKSEFDRLGVRIPEMASLCTMSLASRAERGLPSRRLGDLCGHFGIDRHATHAALDDARATASMLFACVKRLQCRLPVPVTGLGDLGVSGRVCDPSVWPTFPASGVTCPRAEAIARVGSRQSRIERVLSRLPMESPGSSELSEYLELLDRVLEDRRVTVEEADALGLVADSLGLSKQQAHAAHEIYLRSVVRLALADGILSDLEKQDLETVRRLLCIPPGRLDELLKSERRPARTQADSPQDNAAPPKRNVDGKSVCFTGELRCRVEGRLLSRREAEQMAEERGMVVKKGVSKQLDYLVTADPDSMSGKAKKAREYGVPVLAELVFWQILGINAE